MYITTEVLALMVLGIMLLSGIMGGIIADCKGRTRIWGLFCFLIPPLVLIIPFLSRQEDRTKILP